MDHQFNSETETFDRNNILFKCSNKLPSYCIWDSYGIEKESYNEKYNWWNNVNTKKYIEEKKNG